MIAQATLQNAGKSQSRHKPRPNNGTWVWVRWQANHKWAYCSAAAYRLPRLP